MCLVRYPLGHGLLCVVCLCELHHENAGCPCTGASLSDITVMLYEVMLRLHYGYIMIMLSGLLLWLLHQPEKGCFMAAVPARREEKSVPVASRFLSSLSAPEAKRLNPGFSEQCEQQDSWHQDWPPLDLFLILKIR